MVLSYFRGQCPDRHVVFADFLHLGLWQHGVSGIQVTLRFWGREVQELR